MPSKPEAEQPPSQAIVIDQKEIAKFQASGPKMAVQGKEFVAITTNEDYEASGVFLEVLAKQQKKITDYFETPAKHASALHKWITGTRKQLLDPLERMETVIKAARVRYRSEKEKERLAIQEEERKKARAEQEQQAVNEAQKLMELGETEAADIVLDRVVNAPPPPVIVPSEVPKQSGHSIRKKWKVKSIRNPALLKREFLAPDMKKIEAIVEKLGPDADVILGAGAVEMYEDEIESVRSK